MKIDFKGLLEGATNSIVLKEEVEKVAQERLAICKGCNFNSTVAKDNGTYTSWRPDEHCTRCGCNLFVKTRCMSCECPEKFWLPETDAETDKQLTNFVK